MKNLKYLSILLLAVLSFSLVSCGDDDDVKKDDLVGTWQSTWYKGYEKYTSHPEWDEEWDEAYTEDAMTFNSDYTATDGKNSATWSLDGDQLTIKYKTESTTVKILKLNSSELVIESFEKDTDKEDGEYEFYNQITFMKK